MADRMNQERPAGENQQSQGNDNKGLTPRSNQGDISYYGGGMYSPFDLMRRFSEDVDRMFESLGFGSFGSMMQPWGRTGGRQKGQGVSNAMSTMAWTPAVDVRTEGDDLVVSADLPGMKPENVQIECDANQLIIRGETRDERNQDEKDRGYWYSERSYGSFYRSIPLPQGVNTDNAKASFNNGVLEVIFPGAAKSVKPQRRRIEIGTGPGTPSSQQMEGSQSAQGSQMTQGGQMSSQQVGGNK